MVMRRVLRHHVCLCVLSTAVLASLALLTDQNKVYAGLNCKGVANPSGNGSSSDNNKGRIECDGKSNGRGDGKGQLSGKRTIDMSETGGKGTSNSGHPAVKVHGRGTNITISSELKITDSGSNNNPAIQVENGGVLTVNNVTMTDVHKGIEVSGGGSSVTVVKGSIEVRNGGGAVIEVRDGGDVTLNRGVKVSGGGDNTGIEVNGTGGTVTLVGTNFSKVKTGIVFKGTGTANVVGVGATINLASGGTGIKMEGDGRANATVMNMAFMGNRTATGAEVTSGTLTVNTVTMTNV
ncbi:hypothetical protein, partial [Bartonella melophagi]